VTPTAVVSDEAQVPSAFGRMRALDVLVNCAAVLIKRPFAELSAQEWDVQLGAGLRGAFLRSQEAFRLMRGHGGSIVMVSSLSGVAGAKKFPGMAAYVAAKSGLAAWSKRWLWRDGRSASASMPSALAPLTHRCCGLLVWTGHASKQARSRASWPGWLRPTRRRSPAPTFAWTLRHLNRRWRKTFSEGVIHSNECQHHSARHLRGGACSVPSGVE